MSLQITVPPELHKAMTDECGLPFADSYLCGAIVQDGKLLPYTQTGWGRLKDNAAAMHVIRKAKLTLVKPPPFGSVPLSYRQAA